MKASLMGLVQSISALSPINNLLTVDKNSSDCCDDSEGENLIRSDPKVISQGPRSDFVIGGASEREARAFARGVWGDAPREILKFRPSAMAKNATKFVSCDKMCPIFI